MTPSQAASVSWREYTAALQALSSLPWSQRDLFSTSDARARVEFWRATWVACEREAARVH